MSGGRNSSRIRKVSPISSSSRSAPQRKSLPSNFSQKKRTSSPENKNSNGSHLVQVINTLLSKVGFLPIQTSKINVLTTHLNSLLQTANRYKNFISSSQFSPATKTSSTKSADFWAKWDKYTEDFTNFLDDLTINHSKDICLQQLSQFHKALENLKKHAPHKEDPHFTTFVTSLESLESELETIENSIKQKFGIVSPKQYSNKSNHLRSNRKNSSRRIPKSNFYFNEEEEEEEEENEEEETNENQLNSSEQLENINENDEEMIVTQSRQLIKPLMLFRDTFNSKEIIKLFQASILTPKDASSLKMKCIHAIEIILESVRGLRTSVKVRQESLQLLMESESEIDRIFPRPKRNLMFSPKNYNKLLIQKKNVQQESSQKKVLMNRRDVSLILDQRKSLMKQCEISLSFAEDKDQILAEITKRKKMLNQRKTTAKTEAQKKEISRKLRLLRTLENSLEEEAKGNEEIELEISNLQKKLIEQTDLQKKANSLRQERDELLEKKRKAEKRLLALQNEEERRAPSNHSEDVTSLQNENVRLKEQLTFLQTEQQRLIEEMIKCKAQNDLLANYADIDTSPTKSKQNRSNHENVDIKKEIIENGSLRMQKMKILSDIENVKEEIEMLKCFQSKANHLNILPESNNMSKEALMNEYKATLKAHVNIQRQKETVKSQLQSIQKRRELLFYNATKSELQNSNPLTKIKSHEKSEKDILMELEQCSNDYQTAKKKYAAHQLSEQENQFESLKYQTDLKIMKLRKELLNSSSPKKDFQKRAFAEGRQEIEIMRDEMRQLEDSTKDIKRWMTDIQTQLNEARAKKSAIIVQSTSISQKKSETEVDEYIDRLCEKNHQLRLLLEDVKIQLTEIDETLGAGSINDHNHNNEEGNELLIKRLDSIESRLGAVIEHTNTNQKNRHNNNK
ncbi:hypothetical protein TRFO_04981 [Tritrichomonas foetus]|uniref:Uncharacterized protein n=1 Tax=Tritrichomonas foetus TaxID=1144522 RepID=A0A1J4KA92_9EUKA|nr:hypothetical protein TRFO_04981 [Tritrichomonas foetus]|eukprot:OHT08343.1 hypothetical protein TRFO_04981 [Tritrichomonas foetus]